jgi:ABC-type bacteriocin/lantibiotic exporter with double-glycine peptidase domain
MSLIAGTIPLSTTFFIGNNIQNMQLTNFHIDIQTIVPTFWQQFRNRIEAFLAPVFGIFLAILVVPIVIVIFCFAFALNFLKAIYNKYILKKAIDEAEEEENETEEWIELYKNDQITIKSCEFYSEGDAAREEWDGDYLLKLQTEPDLGIFKNQYFQTQTFVFCNQLIVCLVEVGSSKIIQFDLTTFELKLIHTLDGLYFLAFELVSENVLKISVKRGYESVTLMVKSYEHE